MRVRVGAPIASGERSLYFCTADSDVSFTVWLTPAEWEELRCQFNDEEAMVS